MKAKLIIEMPENCMECPCGNGVGDECCVVGKEVGTYEDNYINGQYERPDWCPLVSMPDGKEESDEAEE